MKHLFEFKVFAIVIIMLNLLYEAFISSNYHFFLKSLGFFKQPSRQIGILQDILKPII